MSWASFLGTATPACIDCLGATAQNLLVLRSGDGLAYAPQLIHLAGPSVVNYTSDGSNALEFLLWVTDIAGQNVTAGKIFCHCQLMPCLQ